MADFKEKLAAQRAKEALDKQLKKVAKDSAPNLNPATWNPRKPKVEEPPPPDLRELDLPVADRLKLSRLITKHAALSAEISQLTKDKKTLTEEIKPLCKVYELTKFQVNGSPVVYYQTIKSTISKELLLGQGVSPEIIAKATITKPSWAFKSRNGKKEDGDEFED